MQSLRIRKAFTLQGVQIRRYPDTRVFGFMTKPESFDSGFVANPETYALV